MEKIKTFFKRHQVIPAIIIALLSNFIWAIFQTLLNNINFFEAILDIPAAIVNFIRKLLTANIPVWSAIIVVAAVVGIIIFALWLYARLSAIAPDNSPLKDYTQDTYKNQKYQWHWDNNQMKDLAPICNSCEGSLVSEKPYGYSSWLLCPNCDERYQAVDGTTLTHAGTYFVNKANKKLKEAKS